MIRKVVPILAASSAVLLMALWPTPTKAAGTLTLPFYQSGIPVNSWFDHNLPGSGNNDNMIRYDGMQWTDGSAYLYGRVSRLL
jgi:hypothetical protein